MFEEIKGELARLRRPALAFLSEEELALLRREGIAIDTADGSPSMLHLRWAAAQAEALHDGTTLPILAVSGASACPTLSERALVYAMLVRCRKVISCRDKLEDMLKLDEREAWAEYKARYEERVLDVFKATWRDELIYPYNIVDNINRYNKQESYILKALYGHLSARVPGRVNEGDEAMIVQLLQMFADISEALCSPELVLLGEACAATEQGELARRYAAGAKLIQGKM
jgi:hypothetical protein